MTLEKSEDISKQTPSMVCKMVHRIAVMLLFLSVVADAIEKGGNVFENEGRYFIQEHAVSKRHVINREYFRGRTRFKVCERLRQRRLTIACEMYCNKCMHGTCTSYWNCDCNSGWTGYHCSQSCSEGRWGPGCIHNCSCQNGAKCVAESGTCLCTNGWTGKHCSEPCPNGYFGMSCLQTCYCKNGATCDHITGICNCTSGYQGALCEKKCPVGSHGYQCTDKCKCQNGAICHHVDGSCECSAGWTGPVCTERCPEGLFGANCSGICNCSSNAACNSITGECICNEGYYGENCEIRCLSADWGMDRSQGCFCEDDNCFSFNGNCSCLPGFYGKNCHMRGCPADRWGYKCTNKCECSNGDSCHPITGVCCCQDSHTGECSNDSKAGFLTNELEKTETCSAVIITTIVCVSVVALLLIATGILFYRHRCTVGNEASSGSNSFRFAVLKNDS